MQGKIFLLIFGLVYIPSTKASSECNLCVDLVEAVEGFILAGDTMDDIINKVEEFCTTLGALQPMCESMIERYLPEIIENVINNNLNPFDICKLLTICTDDDTTVAGPTTTPQPGPWVYVETALEGGRVLTVEPDQHHCWMAHKQGKDTQMWRLEAGDVSEIRVIWIDALDWKPTQLEVVSTYKLMRTSIVRSGNMKTNTLLTCQRVTQFGWQMTCH